MRDAIQHLTETIPTRDHSHSAVVLAAAVLTDAAEGRDLFDCIRIILDHFSPIARRRCAAAGGPRDPVFQRQQ
jgi:hypothetical protein